VAAVRYLTGHARLERNLLGLDRSDPFVRTSPRDLRGGAKIRTHAVSRFAIGASTSDEWPDTTIAEADGLVAAVRGRIDNLTELIADLRRQGIESGTSSADLVLALFRRYGDWTPEVLRGAFAVIVSDGSRLWCFRDHLGFGTLFYRAEREAGRGRRRYPVAA
jgi:Glutamine amidotransferase domain